jgi:hypothetical protein
MEVPCLNLEDYIITVKSSASSEESILRLRLVGLTDSPENGSIDVILAQRCIHNVFRGKYL